MLRPYVENVAAELVEADVFEIEWLVVDAADWGGDPVGEFA